MVDSRSDEPFKVSQLRQKRVQIAYRDKERLLQQLLTDKGIASFRIELFIRAFKREKVLEVWVKEKKQPQFTLLKQYAFCASSGVLGPKNQQGDGQIPEGFYQIDRFNPSSNFYLSLGINYPNRADRRREKRNLSGDIFLHGDCVTIGCIPLTNDKIKEVFLLAVEAKSNGQASIPVHIFPARLDETGWKKLREEYLSEPELVPFWQNLKTGYDVFDKSKELPPITIDAKGGYLVRPIPPL